LEVLGARIRGNALNDDEIYTPKIFAVLDWSEMSSEALREVLEIKKELMTKFLINVEIESTYVNIINTYIEPTYSFESLPCLYVNGRLLSCGKLPAKEEIIQAVLEFDESESELDLPVNLFIRENEPPMNSAVMLEG